jgi:hypothetical protein
MWDAPLAQTWRRAEASLPKRRNAAFQERWKDLAYHYFACERFAELSGSSLRRLSFGRSGTERAVFLSDFRFQDLVCFGDAAVRSAVTCAELSFRVVNVVCGLGLDDDHRIYGVEEPAFLEQLLKRDRYVGSNIVGSLRDFERSIGYELLQEYRNWVTHIGAPRMSVPENMHGPHPVPEDTDWDDPVALKWFVESELLPSLESRIEIFCKAFVPPVARIVNAQFDRVDSNTDLAPFISLAPGAAIEGLVIRNSAVVRGDAMTPSAEYRASNQQSTALRHQRLPGYKHELAVYEAGQYGQGVRFVTRGLRRFMCNALDAELVRFLDRWDSRKAASRNRRSK